MAFVLDDEPEVGEVACRMLSETGINARQFTEAGPFLIELKRSAPDLVLVDLALGNSDAVEVIRELEALKYTGTVLLISGHDEATLAEIEAIGRTHSLYMLPSLCKPFRLSDLKERLQAAPARHNAKPAPADERATSVPQHVRLEDALRKNWLEVWYQPKIDLKSLTVCGAEALIRARHPDLGIIEPAKLLPPAGDPLYKPLSFFVVRRTMADWAVFIESGFALKLSINVPASILNAHGFVELVRRMAPRDPRFPGVIFEVTEDEIIRDPGWMREVATQLKLYNAWISIDDFGTAYASLARLKDLPFVEVKLDRAFVTGCATDKLKYALCQTVADLAHRVGASLCAEGVETAEDLKCLRNLGFDSAQGFFLAKPMPADRFAASFLGKNGGVPRRASESMLADPALRAQV